MPASYNNSTHWRDRAAEMCALTETVIDALQAYAEKLQEEAKAKKSETKK